MHAAGASEGMSAITRPRSETDLLFVEDDAGFRREAAERLRSEGFRVAEAQDGRDALEYLKSGDRPSLLILDLFMPEMDGFQLMVRLRSTPEFFEIPILIISGSVKTGTVAGPHGIVHHLTKPFEIDDLIAQVRRVIGTSTG
jgi:CheY-like chemotaxis protein